MIYRRGSVWWLRAKSNGRRVHRSLDTGDRTLALRRAKDLLSEIRAGRWSPLDRQEQTQLTIGAVVARYLEAWTEVREHTRRGNVSSLRRLVIGSGREWDLDAPITTLTADVVRDFRAKASEVGRPPSSVNSVIRQAASLFNRSIVEDRFYGAELPACVLEFAHARRARQVTDHRYHRPPPAVLDATEDAIPALLEADLNAGVAVLLALGAGLRKSEIAAARWDWVREDAIHVTSTAVWQSKSGKSRRIPLDPELAAALEATRGPRPYVLAGTATERQELVFRRVAKWMRTLGWDGKKAIHELRKEFGSRITEAHGIEIAADLLGHSSIAITDAHYRAYVREVAVSVVRSRRRA